ncbi:MAG: hypothetical protein KDA69_19025 [Planctomycetaceae bacterium]|nr:hypothetical protein [Planctomycetaceae bacterium]
MSNLSISIPDESAAYEPGSEAELDLSWDLDEAPSRLVLRVVWNTAGKGDQDLKIAKVVTIDSPGRSGSKTLVIVLPWGPYSFSGKLISLQWGFELIAFPSSESIREEFTLAPEGREVRLLANKA